LSLNSSRSSEKRWDTTVCAYKHKRNNWLFAGSLRAGQRAAAVMSLIQSAKLNGHDPYAYIKDVLSRLPTHKNSQIAALLPHRWQPILTVA
jgi:hypothetical protein